MRALLASLKISNAVLQQNLSFKLRAVLLRAEAERHPGAHDCLAAQGYRQRLSDADIKHLNIRLPAVVVPVFSNQGSTRLF